MTRPLCKLERNTVRCRLEDFLTNDNRLELRDINDELQTLHKLFEQQKETIDQMYKLYESPVCASKSVNGRSILQEALDKLGEYSHQIDIMIKNTERTREDVSFVLRTTFGGLQN